MIGYALYAYVGSFFGLKILSPLFCAADCTCIVAEQ
jgi:hypothetical protein